MPDDRTTLHALLRNDYHAFMQKAFETVNPGRDFLPNWHTRSMAWHLAQCYAGNIRLLIITLPPRHLKSLSASVAFPAWVLGHDPTRRVICASHGDDLAAMFSLQTRAVMQTPWYQRTFPMTKLSKSKNTEREFVTTRKGNRFSTSVGGSMTGRGANFIIIDDPIKTNEATSEAERNQVNEWFRNTVFSRLDDKNKDVIIIVMQRVHVNDLVGNVSGLLKWTVLDLPAIAPAPACIQIGDNAFHEREEGDIPHPAHEDQAALDEIKQVLGSFAFEAQYQQNPLPPEGNMVKLEWFKRYAARPSRDVFSQIVQSWDTATETGAATSYSVCTTWGILENRYYLLHVLRERMDFPALKSTVIRHARNWGADTVLIEKAGSGHALLQCLLSETNLSAIAITPEFDKETRLAQASPQIEAGRVHLPTEALWLAEFEKEVLAFPNGKFDDQVDSLSQFIRWVIFYQPRHLYSRLTNFTRGGDSGGIRVTDNYAARMGASVFGDRF